MNSNSIKTKVINANNRKLVRLSIFRSNRGYSASLIDDKRGVSLTSISTLKMDSKLSTKEKAAMLGKEIAVKAKTLKIQEVVFDRNKYQYHGNIKILAESARDSGLKF